jgi:hypothetical protein
MPKVLADMHHEGLYSSLQNLFETHMGMELYRPIGLGWFTEGFWKIHEALDTANQFLSLDQTYRPSDGTRPLNEIRAADGWGVLPDGVYEITNLGYPEMPHRACTVEYFKSVQFDYLVASVPQHVEPYRRLIREFQPHAKLIVQVGNNWGLDDPSLNLLASVEPYNTRCNAMFYHQWFDTELFTPTAPPVVPTVTSYVNVLREGPLQEFLALEKLTNAVWKSYGGQCRDGSINGAAALAESMKNTSLVCQIKPGGDGYGRIVHNAAAIGRPMIVHRSHYRGQLGAEFMQNGMCVDLDGITASQASGLINAVLGEPGRLAEMSRRVSDRFLELVDFDVETKQIREWLSHLV